jgi:CRISPR-associated protein Cas1
MSWRTIVISRRAKLDYRMNYMEIRTDTVTKVFIREISVLIIESTAVSLTAGLLNELIKNKVKIIFCDEARNPSSELIAYYGNHNTSLKVREQIVWSQGSKDSVWTEIVTEKIKKQKELLERLNKKESKMLAGFIDEIEYKDASNREGHAAKVYFNSLFGMKFTRTQENPFNAALNYGYSILLSAINRVITSNGYITQLGLFHDSMFNPFNLGSDLMEPFRPLVDETVFFMKPDEFNTEEKRVLQNILNQEVIIEDKRQLVSNAIKIYCKSIFEALTQNDISIIKFYTNEL